MNRIHTVLRPALALTVAAVVAACFTDENNEALGPKVTADKSIFESYVSLGNSITAGFQSSGINDSTQRRSYAVLLAGQMGGRFAYPSLAGRGCVPPVNNFQTQARQGTGSTSTTCDLRNATTVTDILNNVAVPGARVADLTAASGTVNSNTLTSLFLGGKTQVAKALEADPTFASVFVGGNDVLGAAATGFLVPVTGVTAGITATTAFATSFDAAVDGLIAGAPGLKGVLVGVPKVTNIPLFFAVGVLQASAPFLAGFDQAAGRVPASTDPFKSAALTIDANCGGAAAATLISFPIASSIGQFRNDTNATGQPPKAATSRVGHPPYIACGVSTTPGAPAAPVGDAFILDLTEQATITTATDAYNTKVSSKATTLGWAYVNPNALLDSIRAAGAVPAAPNLASPTATFGAWFSLDGFHPSNLAHRAITNHLINAINTTYSTNLVRITVP